MEDAGKVSIISPVYNAAGYVADAIRSVIAQTYSDWELWLVDDGSSDESVKVVSQVLDDDRIRLIELKENKGAAYARNTGIKMSTGRYIAFIDSDDLWAVDKLEKELKFMADTGAAFAYTAVELGYTNVSLCCDGEHSWVDIDGRLYDLIFAKNKSFELNYDAEYTDYRAHPVISKRID